MAKFFDGVSSKPHYVNISIEHGYIVIVKSETHEEIKRWYLSDSQLDNLNAGNEIILAYGSFPKETLHFNAADYPEIYESILSNQSKVTKSYHLLNRFNPVQLVGGSVLIIALSVVVYLKFLAPWIGTQVVKMIPQSFDERVGETVLNQLLAFEEVDSLKSEYLQEFFKLCNYPTDYNIRTTFVNGNTVNAFAAPGGFIVVYDGLTQRTESYEELAALLAHELGHVNQRHSMVNLARSVSGYLVLSVITGDVAGSSGVILEQANQLHELSNSRRFEQEADDVGLDYMEGSSIDKTGMLKLFEHISEKTASDTSFWDTHTPDLEFLSTHPNSETRMINIRENLSIKFNDHTHNEKLDSLWRLIIQN